MARKTIIGLEEQLEIDKLHERELTANKGGEFDILYDQVKKDNDVQAKVAENKDNADVDGSGEEEDDSSSTDSDADTTDDLEVDPEAIEATESIRNLQYSPESIGVALTVATEVAVVLGTLGIQYTAYAITHLFKGVINIFVKIARLLYTSSFMLKKYIERRVNSFDNLKDQISSLKKTIKEIQEKNQPIDPDKLSQVKYSSETIINVLKAGESVNFTENINQLTGFVTTTIKGMSTQIVNDTSSVLHIMSSSRSGTGKLPSSIMAVRTDAVGLVEGPVEGYEPGSEYVTSYRSNVPLPGEVVLVAALPREHLEEFEDTVKAYNDSSIILGFDISTFRKVEAVDYMTIEQLSGFVDSLEQLCGLCIEHQKLYDQIAQSKSGLKNSLRNFFSQLSNSHRKVSVKDSFIEYIYLKSMFVDKVYLSSMIDIHDYVSKVISAGTRYAKSNIEQLA